MKCPNINDETWKDIVKEYGELEAYLIYIKNGYEIPTKEEFNELERPPYDEKSEKEAVFLRKVTEVRGNLLNALRTKHEMYKDYDVEYIAKLRKLANTYASENVERSLFAFIHNAERELKSLNTRINKKGEKSISLLHQLDAYKSMYDVVDDILESFEYLPDEYLDVISKDSKGRSKSKRDTFNGYIKRLREIRGKKEDFEKAHRKYTTDVLVTRLAQNSTKASAQYKERFEKKYENDYPRAESSLSKKEYNQKKREYVDRNLNDSREEIYATDRRNIRNHLLKAPTDISELTGQFIDPRGVNEYIIQITVNMLDEADFNVKKNFNDQKVPFLKTWSKFIDGKRGLITNQRKLYANIIELDKDGKSTGYFTRELMSEYYIEKSKAFREYRDNELKGVLKEKNTVLTEFNKKYLKKPDLSDKFNVLYAEGNVKKEYHNPQFTRLRKDEDRSNAYDEIISFRKESDQMVVPGLRLGYRLAGITKTNTEKLMDNKPGEAIKEMLQESIMIRADDDQYGDLTVQDGEVRIKTDQAGNLLQKVGMPYRNKLKSNDQSFDLFGMELANRAMSLNYKYKADIQNDLELLKGILGNQEVIDRKGGKKLWKTAKQMLGVSDDEATDIAKTIKGDQSNLYKTFNNILEDRLYGRHDVPTVLGRISIDKISSNISMLAADNMMMFGVLSGKANVLMGKTMNFLEGVSGRFVNRKDLRAGEAKYIKDSVNVLKDIDQPLLKAKTNLLLERFGFDDLSFNDVRHLIDDATWKRVISKKTAYGANSLGEHYIASTIMYGLLNNTKVKDLRGNYVDGDGNIVKTRDEAATMDEMYIVKYGKLEWKDYNFTIEGHKDLKTKAEFSVESKLKEIQKNIQGNYSSVNKSNIQRYWYGKQLTFMRKHVIPGFNRRWRGAKHSFKKVEDLEEHERFYSEALQDYQEGTYTSTLRYASTLAKKGKKLYSDVNKDNQSGTFVATLNFFSSLAKQGKKISYAITTSEWNKLTDLEKGNIRSAITEMSLIVLALLSAKVLAELAEGADDDETKEYIYNYAYICRRLYGDLITYTPLGAGGEGLRTLQTPMVSLSYIKKVMKALSQLTGDIFDGEFEEYEKGRYKDQYKSAVYFRDIVDPLWGNYTDRVSSEAYKYLTTGLN